MGMAASQMRLLAITARKSDLEYSAQQLSNVKIQLSNQSEVASQNYVNALNKKKLQVTTVDPNAGGNGYLTTSNITVGDLATSGYIAGIRSNPDNGTYTQVPSTISSEALSAGLISGQYLLFSSADLANLNTAYAATPISISGVANIQEVEDDSGFALAEAVYNQETAKLQRREKQIDMQIQKIDTEHSAIESEYESVKKVIEDNVESSFSIFG